MNHPPSSFSYLDEVQRQVNVRKASETMFRAVTYSIPDHNNGESQYIVGGSNFGVVCVWEKLRNVLNTRSVNTDKPVFKFEVGGSISKVHFENTCYGKLLLVSTFQGSLQIYDWIGIVQKVNSIEKSEIVENVQPIGKIETSSVNSFILDFHNEEIIITTAGLDGLKQWIVSDFASGNFTINFKFYDDSSSFQDVCCSAGKVYSGGNKGYMGVWDLKTRTSITTFPIKQLMNSNISLVKSNLQDATFSGWSKSDELEIKSIDIDSSDTWLVCCGNVRASKGDVNGFICIFHSPTKMLTASYVTTDTLDAVVHHEGFDVILTVSNNGAITFWNRSTVSQSHITPLSSKSGFVISVNPYDYNISVGGSSPNIDCFIQRVKSYTLTMN